MPPSTAPKPTTAYAPPATSTYSLIQEAIISRKGRNHPKISSPDVHSRQRTRARDHRSNVVAESGLREEAASRPQEMLRLQEESGAARDRVQVRVRLLQWTSLA